MIKLSKASGFSLVELMIVVAIMAILAAIAIPSYLRFQIRARESEARINLAAVRTCEEAYKAENDAYIACTANPSAWAAGAAATKPISWDTGVAGWDDIGFEPDGDVRYQYAVAETTNINLDYTATARGDVDGDGTAAVFTVTDANAKPTKSPSDAY